MTVAEGCFFFVTSGTGNSHFHKLIFANHTELWKTHASKGQKLNISKFSHTHTCKASGITTDQRDLVISHIAGGE